jgi:hypothetical protein
MTPLAFSFSAVPPIMKKSSSEYLISDKISVKVLDFLPSTYLLKSLSTLYLK